MTTVTITLDNQKEASLLIAIAKKLMSVKSIKEDKRSIAAKGEPMTLKEFKAMISESEKSGFISAEQLKAEIKKW